MSAAPRRSAPAPVLVPSTWLDAAREEREIELEPVVVPGEWLARACAPGPRRRRPAVRKGGDAR